MKVFMVSRVNVIVGDRFRKEYKNIHTLAQSIKERGLINPITVTPAEEPGKFNLIAGGRRIRAIDQFLPDFGDIPCRLYEDLDELDRYELELMENIQRENLSWDEEVANKNAIHKLQMAKAMRDGNPVGWSQEKTAELLGESPSGVSQDLRLADLLEKIPSIKDVASTKQEATKLLKQMQKEYETEKAAEDIKSQRAVTPLDLQHKKLIDSYIVSDFFEGAKSIPDKSADLIHLDWPFGVDLNAQKKESNIAKATTGDKYIEIDAKEYKQFAKKVLKEAYRIAKEGSWLVCWFDEKMQSEIADLIEEAGFEVGLRIPAVWIATGGQTQSPHRYLARTTQPFFYCRKGAAEIQKQGRMDSFLYNRVPSQQKVHKAEMPINMLTDLLVTFIKSGKHIVDCFLGSGNVILAASNIGCSCIGFDMSETNKNGFIVKVMQQKPGEYSSYRTDVSDSRIDTTEV